MKFSPFLALHLANAEECAVPLAAEWCIDAADLEYRKCLAQFNCHVEDSVSCTDVRKTYCWYDHQIRLYECPCSDIVGPGCGESEPNFCQSYPENIWITREGDPFLIYTNVLVPPEIITTFGYSPNPDPEWSKKYDDHEATCAYQIADQVFFIGGDRGYRDNFQLKAGNFIRLPDLPIEFSYGVCASYGNSEGMICSPIQDGRQCYYTSDGRTYTNAGKLKQNHLYGQLVPYGDTVFILIGQVHQDTIFFEDFNSDLNDPQWTVKQSVHIEDTLLSGLLGLTGFRAVNVPYKNAVSDEMILIVGGYNDWKDAPSTDVYYSFVDSVTGVMSTRVHPEKLIEPRSYHTHVTNRLASDYPFQMYFIGGNEYNNFDGTIEIWEMIWDHDPAFYPDGYKGCPQWCYWEDIFGIQETPGGLCSSDSWSDIESNQMSCSFYEDHPQFKKRLMTEADPQGILRKRYSMKAFYLN